MELVTVEGANSNMNVRSPSIWGRMPFDQIRNGQVGGVAIYEDFASWGLTPPTTEGNWAAQRGWSAFTSGTATWAAPAATAATKAGVPNGGITFGSSSDNGINGFRTKAVKFMLNRANAKFCAEICMAKSTIANTTLETFFGLLEDVALDATHPFTTTAATMSDNNMMGIHSTESAGSAGSSVYTANGVTAVTVGSGEFTFAAATYTKIGMKYEPSGDPKGSYILSFYQNGTRLASYKQLPDSNGTDFPTDVAMGLFFGSRQAAGSSSGTMSVKWVAAAQLYDPQG